ncbi:hypothetical protein [Lentzea terrae]|uniref:hypothetical protein n=1 Tax=Lentzea terrae TaxID=2200761 RepID=UPI001300582D|nr:hypothetical protein [Lentzea terrae]
MSTAVPPESVRPGTTTDNKIQGTAMAAAQAGVINGDVYFHGIPGGDLQPGLVSTIPPTERLVGRLYGREHLIDHLVEVVRRNDGSKVVLHGTGGGGKTAVALGLADKLATEQPHIKVWWVDASTESSLNAGLREVAYDADPQRIDESARAWAGKGSAPDMLKKALLAARGSWVIVLDGADDCRMVEKWCQALRLPSGSVIFTSRHGKSRLWTNSMEVHAVGPLSEGAAVELLCGLAPGCGTEQQASDLVCSLGYLPLAVRLAGQYLNAARTLPPVAGLALPGDFEQYRLLFHDRFPELDELHKLQSEGQLDERELLFRTWELSLDLLADLGMPWARPLLRWMSCFEQAPIPYVIANAKVLGQSPLFEGLTGYEVLRAFVVLGDFGLIEEVMFNDARSSAVTTKCYLLHPVIREASRHQPDLKRDLEKYLKLCVAALDGYTCDLASNDPHARSMWAALSPHCELIVDWIYRVRDELPDPTGWELLATKLTCVVAQFALYSGSYVRAAKRFEQALAVRIRHLGEKHPESLAVRRQLALLRKEKHGARLAIPDFVALVEDAKEALSELDPFALECQLDLASLLAEVIEDDTVVDVYREIVHLSHQLHGHAEVTGLTAQMSLVAALVRRDDERCPIELLKLMTMVDEIGRTPGEAERLPFGLESTQSAIMKLLQRYLSGRRFLADGT